MIVDVVIEQDKDRWFAMSHHEVDYFCEALTLSDVVTSFIGGFGITLQRNDDIAAFLLREAPAVSQLPPKGKLHRIVTRSYKHEQSLSEFDVEFRFWLAAVPSSAGDDKPVPDESPATASEKAPTAGSRVLLSWTRETMLVEINNGGRHA